MKKCLSVLMAFALIFSMTVFASAAGGDTVTVNTSAELYTALKNKAVSKVVLGKDIVVDRTDIIIEPTRTSAELVIDGNGHTLTEYFVKTYDTSKGIRVAKKGTLSTITMQNINIVGQNGYGTVYVPSSVKGITQKYINVTYAGPQITHNINGNAYYEDSTIDIRNASGGTYSGEVAEITNVTLAGEVNITKAQDTDGCADEIFWIAGGDGMINVLPGANVTIDNNSHGQSTPSGFVYGGCKYSIDIGAGARFEYNGWEQFWECKAPTNFTVNEGAQVEINVKYDSKKGYKARPILTVEKNMTVKDNASFALNTDGDLTYAALRVNGNLKTQEGARFKVVSTGNSLKSPCAPLLTMNGKAEFYKPAELLLYNSNDGTHAYARAIGYACAGDLSITASEVSYWTNAASSGGPTVLRNPSSTWANTSGEFTVNGSVKSGTAGSFKSLTTSGYNGSNPLNATTFNTVGVKVIAVGTDFATYADYTVNHLDSETGKELLSPVVKNAEVGTQIFAADEKATIDGYTFDEAKTVESITVAENSSSNILNIYYSRANGSYTVKYYTDEVGDANFLGEVTEAGFVGDPVNPDLNLFIPTGYKGPGTIAPGSATVISSVPANNIVYVVYTDKVEEYSYTVVYIAEVWEDEESWLEQIGVYIGSGALDDEIEPDLTLFAPAGYETPGEVLKGSATHISDDPVKNVVTVKYSKMVPYTVKFTYFDPDSLEVFHLEGFDEEFTAYLGETVTLTQTFMNKHKSMLGDFFKDAVQVGGPTRITKEDQVVEVFYDLNVADVSVEVYIADSPTADYVLSTLYSTKVSWIVGETVTDGQLRGETRVPGIYSFEGGDPKSLVVSEISDDNVMKLYFRFVPTRSMPLPAGAEIDIDDAGEVETDETESLPEVEVENTEEEVQNPENEVQETETTGETVE